MTSAFHRPRGLPEGIESVRRLRVTWRLHPVLSDVLNVLERTSLGQAFKERAVEVSTSKAISDPLDHAAALAAHRWVLERANGDGLPLTAAGYLKPADVQALAGVLPTMDDWIFQVSREIDAYPVLSFREHLKDIGLLRKYKGSLRLTKAGREGLADATQLWRRVAESLVPAEPGFNADTRVVILVHAATTEGEIDVDAVAKVLTALGWSHRDGSPVSRGEVFQVWNGLWDVVGNVGERAAGHHRSDRTLSVAARILVHDALFDETESESIPQPNRPSP